MPRIVQFVLCLLLWSAFGNSLSLSAGTLTFGDAAASTGWLDLGLQDNTGTPQQAVYQSSMLTPSGEVVFTLTLEASVNLGVSNSYLGVRGGIRGTRIDSRDFANTADDEWISFQMDVSGAGAEDLTGLEFVGMTLNSAGGDLVEFTDGASGSVSIQDPGSALLTYGSGEDLDGLASLSLSNVGGLGDGSWALKVTARAFGVSSNSVFRVATLSIGYTIQIPEAPVLDTNGLILHLDAGVISDVADGAALSGGWSDLSASALVASSPNPPVYYADGGGGYPAVRFDGVNDYLQADVATGDEVSVFVVFAHQRATLQASYRDMLLTGASGGTNLSLASSRSVATAPNLPSFNALTGNGLTFHTWVNGHSTEDVSGDLFKGRYYVGSAVFTEVPADTALLIGTRGTGGINAGQNDIRELLVYNRALSEAERLSVQAYLAEKYKIAAVTRTLDHPVESYPHVLGSQQFGDQYSFGESSIYTLDYARQTLRQGNCVVKFRLSEKYANTDGFTQTSGINTLTKLVRDQPEVKEIFDMPLTDYLFWVSTFSVPKWQNQVRAVGDVAEADWTAFYGANRSLYAANTYSDPAKAPTEFQGLDPADAQQIYNEVYDLAVYLLQNYSGTGKNFYLGNWEGDWMLSGTGTYLDQSIPPERLQAMIDWANIRQQAIDDAKAATAHSDVNVWFYLEANKMDWARDGDICVTNTVIPVMPQLDFISFSSYSLHKDGGFTADETQMHSDLNILQSRIDAKPDPSILGSRLIIGEYGFQFGNTGRFADFEEHAQEHVTSLRNFLSWQGGTLRFILQWQFYSRQVTEADVPYEMCQISELYEIRPLYYLHENFYIGMREWLDAYYTSHGTLPTDREYADEAYQQLAGISLSEHVPDLSTPWPDRIEIQDSGSVVIPDAVDGVSTYPLQTTLYSRFGRVMPTAAMNWSIAPDQQGVTVDSNGSVSVQGNGSPDSYLVTAALDAYPDVFGSNSLQAMLPVSSIYDQLDDFSKSIGGNSELTISSTNAATRFDGDQNRVSRISSTSPEEIVWYVPNLNRFHAKVYYYGDIASNLSAEVSADGVDWQPLVMRVDPPLATADGWQRSWVAPLNPLPVSMNYIRLLLQDPTNAWTPQVGEVVLFGEDTGFNFWKAQQFSDPADLSEPAVSGPSADPLQTGIPNLYRYFADLPLDADDWSGLAKMENVAGQFYYTLPFDPTKLDVRAQVKGSLDLQNWDYPIFDSINDTAILNNGWLWLNADTLPASDAKFFKLELSL